MLGMRSLFTRAMRLVLGNALAFPKRPTLVWSTRQLSQYSKIWSSKLPTPENPKSVLYSPALCLHLRKQELDFTDESKSRERPLPLVPCAGVRVGRGARG